MFRLVVGFLVAPVAAAAGVVLIAVASPAVPVLTFVVRASDVVPEFPATDFGFALIFASVATVLGAVPLFSLVRRRREARAWMCALAGMGLGAAPFALLAIAVAVAALQPGFGPITERLKMLSADGLLAAITGSFAGTCFYLIAVKGSRRLEQDRALAAELQNATGRSGPAMPSSWVRRLSPTQRLWLLIFVPHVIGTLFVGCVLMPIYVGMDGPPPPPFWRSVGPVVRTLMWIFDFPFILEMDRIGVTSIVFPSLGYVIANSSFVSGVVTVVYVLWRRILGRAA